MTSPSPSSDMFVKKRNGDLEVVDHTKIHKRLMDLEPDSSINIPEIVDEIVSNLETNISTSKIDDIAANIVWRHGVVNPKCLTFASKIIASNLAKNTEMDILKKILLLEKNIDTRGKKCSLVSPQYASFVKKYAHEINKRLDYSRDELLDPSGFNVVKNKYLLRTSAGKLVERFQDLLMRVAIDIHRPRGKTEIECIDERLKYIWETYEGLSTKKFIHASPTLFNAGLKNNQYFSCFLLGPDDNLESINNTMNQMSQISKRAGGIGVHISQIRGKGALIRSTNGVSNGITPLCQMFQCLAKYINQGGKRNGSIAVYCEMWHVDIRTFLQLPRHDGNEEIRARDLFYALWIDDEFMKRVERDDDWWMFDPDMFPGLSEVYGEEFTKLYNSYIDLVKDDAEYRRKNCCKAHQLYMDIIHAQSETGRPYMLSKDACNAKSNQKNLGTIKSSNLCAEIVEYSSSTETACCCLASLCLPSYVKDNKFDFDELGKWVRVIVRNLDRMIEYNFYPTPETKRSNIANRPLGIGIQGLADVFVMLKLAWGDDETLALDEQIHETMYYHAMDESCNLAMQYGAYQNFKGSPLSMGQFQFNLWNKADSSRFDWESLRQRVMTHGVRNSLLLALMPTASTSLIMGFNECFEPFTSHMYVRRTLSGELKIVNHRLVNDLINLGLWNTDIFNKIVKNNGTIGNIDEIPLHIRKVYKTSFEMSMKQTIIAHAARRYPFICQSMSLNLFVKRPQTEIISSMHMYTWKLGFKTMIYYLRSQAALQTEKIGAIKQDDANEIRLTEELKVSSAAAPSSPTSTSAPLVCTRDGGGCCDG